MDKEKCDNCGTELIIDCPVCGAPNCCPKCCREATAELKEHLAEISPKKCPKCEVVVTVDEMGRMYLCDVTEGTDIHEYHGEDGPDCLRRQLSNMAIKNTRLLAIVKCLLVRCDLTTDEIKRLQW